MVSTVYLMRSVWCLVAPPDCSCFCLSRCTDSGVDFMMSYSRNQVLIATYRFLKSSQFSSKQRSETRAKMSYERLISPYFPTKWIHCLYWCITTKRRTDLPPWGLSDVQNGLQSLINLLKRHGVVWMEVLEFTRITRDPHESKEPIPWIEALSASHRVRDIQNV